MVKVKVRVRVTLSLRVMGAGCVGVVCCRAFAFAEDSGLSGLPNAAFPVALAVGFLLSRCMSVRLVPFGRTNTELTPSQRRTGSTPTHIPPIRPKHGAKVRTNFEWMSESVRKCQKRTEKDRKGQKVSFAGVKRGARDSPRWPAPCVA